MNLSIVIVSFNTRDMLQSCLTSVEASVGLPQYEVWVVDNNSKDGSVEMVQEFFPAVHLIGNSENRGFAAGNNQAIIRSQAHYIMLLNSDTIMLPDVATKVVSFMESHPLAGAVGCKLLNMDGSLQPSVTTFPNPLKDAIGIGLKGAILKNDARTRARLTLVTRLLGIRLSRFDDHATTKEVDYPRGACLTVRRETIEQVGLLDEGYFFAGEEMDWCYRMKRQGWRVYYYPEAAIIHYDHGASGHMMGKVFVQTRKSTLRFYEKHYGRGKTELMRFLVCAVLLLKSLALGFRLLLPSANRQTLLARIESYLTVVRIHYDGVFRSMNVFSEMPFRYN
jgi:GT2 family glycosyltransferase